MDLFGPTEEARIGHPQSHPQRVLAPLGHPFGRPKEWITSQPPPGFEENAERVLEPSQPPPPPHFQRFGGDLGRLQFVAISLPTGLCICDAWSGGTRVVSRSGATSARASKGGAWSPVVGFGGWEVAGLVGCGSLVFVPI